MYRYDLAWLPVFVSNICKIDTNVQNLKVLWQALWKELEKFTVSLLPSLTKQKARGNNHLRTELLPPIKQGIGTYICQIQHISHTVLASACFLFFSPLSAETSRLIPLGNLGRQILGVGIQSPILLPSRACCYANLSTRNVWTLV